MLSVQPRRNLGKADILCLLHQSPNEGLVRIKLRAARLALPAGSALAALPKPPDPDDRRRNPHAEPFGRGAGRHTIRCRLDHPTAKIRTVGLRHQCPHHQRERNHVMPQKGIPTRIGLQGNCSS